MKERRLRGYIIRLEDGRMLGRGARLVSKPADALRAPSEEVARRRWETTARVYKLRGTPTIEFMDVTVK